MPAEVFFHVDFFNSDSRSKYFADLLSLTDEEEALLFNFAILVKLGQRLEGKNKNSWTNEHGVDVKSVSLKYYKTNDLWHYHTGPYKDKPFYYGTIRNINLQGKTSDAVVHYKWYDKAKTKLIILAFSPTHRPFPKPGDKPNPLNNRSGLLFTKNIVPF